MQDERFTELKASLKKAKKQNDPDLIAKVKGMLVEERDFASKQKKAREDKKQKDAMKSLNKERIAEGKDPVYLKRSQAKQMHLKDKFDKLEGSGKLDTFMER